MGTGLPEPLIHPHAIQWCHEASPQEQQRHGRLKLDQDKRRSGRDLTKGDILSNVLYMGVPSMIGFAAMVVYQLTDMFWLARVGTAEVAGVTLFGSVAMVLGSINSMVGSGSVAVISRRYGEGDIGGTRNAAEQTVVMKFSIGMVMGLVGYLTIRLILAVMTGDALLVDLGTDYGKIYFLGLPFMFTSYTIYTALRGIGDAPKAMGIMLFSTGLNMILDPLFIIKLGLGVEGAATATVISAICAVSVGVWVMSSGVTNIRIRLGAFRPDIPVMSRILKIGFPPFLENIARSVSMWLIAVFVAYYGTTIVASYGISMRIVELGIVFAVGLNLGSSAIVGQSMGAGKPDRAAATSSKAALVALGIAVSLSVVEIIFARQIMGLFGKSEAVQAMGSVVLVYFAIGQPFVAVAIALSSAFFGSGNTWPPTITGLLTTWVFQIPLTAVLVYVLNKPAWAIWIVMILTHAIYLGLLIVWFRLGRWKHREV
jgi:putative MATE family efflux protein